MMKVLLITDPGRPDLYSFLFQSNIIEYESLWFESKSDDITDYTSIPFSFKHTHYWTNFKTAKDLLEKIKPDKLIFFEIIDHKQIATIIAANYYKVPTFFCDHGAANDREQALLNLKNNNYKTQKLTYLSKKLKSVKRLILNKYYYYDSIVFVRNLKSLILFVLIPVKSQFFVNPMRTLKTSYFPERVPNRNILFNKINSAQYALLAGDIANNSVITGVPYFDVFYNTLEQKNDHVIYIEHPMLESNLLNWDLEHHKKLAVYLNDFSIKRKTKVIIKLHPRSNMELWQSYHLNSPYISIIQSGDFNELLLTSKLILSYSSSLVTGFLCAKKNVVNVGWHPQPQIYGVNFSKYELCHASLHIEDLDTKYDYWLANNLCVNNEEKYVKFIEDFNCPFDGKASQRIIKLIENV